MIRSIGPERVIDFVDTSIGPWSIGWFHSASNDKREIIEHAHLVLDYRCVTQLIKPPIKENRIYCYTMGGSKWPARGWLFYTITILRTMPSGRPFIYTSFLDSSFVPCMESTLHCSW